MGLFKKKPVVIEAMQFTVDNLVDVQNFVGIIPDHDDNTLGFRMARTIEGAKEDPGIVARVWDKLHSTWVGVKTDQWIIRGVQGEFYPCDPDVFESTYEEVNDGSTETSED